jgi:hypothetical protein
LGGKKPINKGGDFGGNLSAGSQRTFDHLLGDRLGATSPVRNIVVGGLDKNHEQHSQSVSWSAPDQAALPLHDPDQTFAALFAGNEEQPAPTDMAERRLREQWEREVLGLGAAQSSLLRSRLGQEELLQLQAYESNLSDALNRVGQADDQFAPPPQCDGLQLDALQAGLSSENYARTHDLQSRTLAAALACGRTRVATYVMASHLGSMTVPGTGNSHHYHDDNALDHYRAFDTYYGNRIRFLLEQLDSYPEGEGTLLDHTIIVWTSDIGWTPIEHDHENHPIYLLGGLPGNVLNMGQYIKVTHAGANREERLADPENRRLPDVLLTLAAAMGVTDLDEFADPAYVRGPIEALLA